MLEGEAVTRGYVGIAYTPDSSNGTGLKGWPNRNSLIREASSHLTLTNADAQKRLRMKGDSMDLQS